MPDSLACVEGIDLGDRELLEQAVALLVSGLPAGWQRLHAECAPPAVEVVATTADGRPQSIPTPAKVVMLLAEHQRRSAECGKPWRRLVIDCDAAGELSAYADPGPSVTSPGRVRQRVQWSLMALTLSLLMAAGVVFAVGWRWGPPPRVEPAALPDPPPRQRQAVEVINTWSDAENRADVPALRALLCTDPSSALLRWVETMRLVGQSERLVFPDAVTGFRDSGARVWVQISVRLRPISESQKQAVDRAQNTGGGFFNDAFTLADEAGQLKVCDVSGILE